MHATDLDLTGKDIGDLTSPNAFATFLARLGYPTEGRAELTPEAIGLAGEAAAPFKRLDRKSLTAKARTEHHRQSGDSR
jgi:hypothetical protein